MLIIGLMSGTSVDAIDAALVDISPGKTGAFRAVVRHHVERAWPKALRGRLLKIMAPARTTTQEICQLHVAVAREFARAVEQVLAETKTPREKIMALGSHGQTVCHLPPDRERGISNLKFQISNLQFSSTTKEPKIASTLQLGDVSVLATLTGITTVGNFRPADMALGGQGAPLVPLADAMLLSHPTKCRAIQNIGGIANVTFLPALDAPGPVLAFDTGPGNMLMDAVMHLATNGKRRFDRDGRRAAGGLLNIPLFRRLQTHAYFLQRPPKSTGRELFGMAVARRLYSQFSKVHGRMDDLIHTLTRLTAWSIADAYLHFLPTIPDEVIVCGGGADNSTLMGMLKEELATLTSEFTHPAPPKLLRIDDFGIPNKAKEAASFAVLAAATLQNRPGNIPSVTGAARPVVLGVVAGSRPMDGR